VINIVFSKKKIMTPQNVKGITPSHTEVISLTTGSVQVELLPQDPHDKLHVFRVTADLWMKKCVRSAYRLCWLKQYVMLRCRARV